jgi:4-carboxymuconolactone decarboxylase
MGSAVGRALRIPDSKLAALSRYRDSAEFDDLERRVLDLATAMSRSPADVPAELRAGLLRDLGHEAVTHLVALVALENFLGRFNRGAGIEAQGYSAGAACLVCERPEPGA